MANLTIRNIDEALKARLRVRAASRGRSMEEEVRHILRAALNEPSVAQPDLAQRIRRRFAPLGDVRLPLPGRESVREPPLVDEPKTGASRNARSKNPGRRA
jgi:plasmid stability protein